MSAVLDGSSSMGLSFFARRKPDTLFVFSHASDPPLRKLVKVSNENGAHKVHLSLAIPMGKPG